MPHGLLSAAITVLESPTAPAALRTGAAGTLLTAMAEGLPVPANPPGSSGLGL
jgi:hypothetical protein